MRNMVCLIGRLIENPIKEELNGKEFCNITLATIREYKNENGEYETDFIPCILWHGIADAVIDYCQKGDLVAIRGRLQNNEGKIVVICEKVMFLSSKKEKESEEN